ncbi:hypothetical protein VUR80DRAFT_5555 [Thermomyces stellatus]
MDREEKESSPYGLFWCGENVQCNGNATVGRPSRDSSRYKQLRSLAPGLSVLCHRGSCDGCGAALGRSNCWEVVGSLNCLTAVCAFSGSRLPRSSLFGMLLSKKPARGERAGSLRAFRHPGPSTNKASPASSHLQRRRPSASTCIPNYSALGCRLSTNRARRRRSTSIKSIKSAVPKHPKMLVFANAQRGSLAWTGPAGPLHQNRIVGEAEFVLGLITLAGGRTENVANY